MNRRPFLPTRPMSFAAGLACGVILTGALVYLTMPDNTPDADDDTAPPMIHALKPLPPEPLDASAMPDPAVPPLPMKSADTPAATVPVTAPSPDLAAFESQHSDALLIPIAGLEFAQLHDTYKEARSNGRVHDALDIMAPEGAPVRAVADGKVVKLFTSVKGGLTLYQFDDSEHYVYYYAHLSRYTPDLKEGDTLKRGELLGYVGHTGNARADAPHLHFGITLLGADKHWWGGEPIDPYPLFANK